jgi:hypothetical protein
MRRLCEHPHPLAEFHPVKLQRKLFIFLASSKKRPHAMFGPSKRTTAPIVTGTSVLAVKYSGGVMMSADTLGTW